MGKLARNAAQAVLSDDPDTVGVERHLEADRAPKPCSVAAVDPLEAILEQTWKLLNRPALHAHACSKCFHLRPCCQQPCKYRATDLEREYDCGCGRE